MEWVKVEKLVVLVAFWCCAVAKAAKAAKATSNAPGELIIWDFMDYSSFKLVNNSYLIVTKGLCSTRKSACTVVYSIE